MPFLTFRHKRSTTAGSIPAASALGQGEWSLNLADRLAYYLDATGVVRSASLLTDAERVNSGPIAQALTGVQNAAVQKSANLSDLSDKVAARTQLGIPGIIADTRLLFPRTRITDLAERIGQTLVGDGVTLEGASLQATLAYAAANGTKLTGGGKSFASATSIAIAAGLDAEDLFVTATSSAMGASGRLLLGSNLGSGSIKLYGTRLRVTGDATLGSMGDSMGLFLNGGAKHILQDIDVSVVGKRSMIALLNMVDSDFIRLFAHDGLYNDTTVTDDCAQAVWVLGTNGCRLNMPRVSNMLGNGALRSGMALPSGVSSTAGSRLWWRGIAVAGNRNLSIVDPKVDGVDQGLDVSGSAGNVGVMILGGTLTDCESHGVKFANTAYKCSAIGTTIERAGRCAVVASGPASAPDSASVMLTAECLAADITSTDCGTRRDSSGTDMASFYAAGGSAIIPFRVEQGSYANGQSYPRGITFDNDKNVDTQINKRVTRGFQNDIPYTLNSGQPNRITATCRSRDYTDVEQNGFHEPKVELQAASNGSLSIPNATATDIDFSVETYDPMSLHSLTSNINLVALEPGTWRSEVTVLWPGNATGARVIDMLLNGSVLGGVTSQIAGQGVDHLHISTAQIVVPKGIASNARVQLTQTSGGALVLNRARLMWRLERLR